MVMDLNFVSVPGLWESLDLSMIMSLDLSLREHMLIRVRSGSWLLLVFSTSTCG